MDVCLMPELLEHVMDWESCLDEACRVLKPAGALYVSTTNRLCPMQQEFDLPLYSWYPGFIKKHCVRLSLTTKPEWVNHAKYPAIHWFTPYQLRDWLAKRGLSSFDRFDLIDVSAKTRPAQLIVRLIRAAPPLRWAAHLATPGTTLVAIMQ
jgi:2-polyprenyl-6-hydroxyphenyl methylase/3-demethylubiquinone-9 3-methyltransferase